MCAEADATITIDTAGVSPVMNNIQTQINERAQPGQFVAQLVATDADMAPTVSDKITQ